MEEEEEEEEDMEEDEEGEEEEEEVHRLGWRGERKRKGGRGAAKLGGKGAEGGRGGAEGGRGGFGGASLPKARASEIETKQSFSRARFQWNLGLVARFLDFLYFFSFHSSRRLAFLAFLPAEEVNRQIKKKDKSCRFFFSGL